MEAEAYFIAIGVIIAMAGLILGAFFKDEKPGRNTPVSIDREALEDIAESLDS